MDYSDIKDLPLTLTVEELAKVLGIGRNSSYRLIQEGKIRCVRCGRKIIIPRTALEEFLSPIA